jgi:hypothetical protein
MDRPQGHGRVHRSPPDWRARGAIVLSALLLATALAGGAILAACSPSVPAPTNSIPAASALGSTGPAPDSTGPSSAVPAPDGPATAPGETALAGPSEAPFTLGTPEGDAIAVAEGSDQRVEASTLTLAEAGVSYVVYAACKGRGWMGYRLVVDDVEVSASRIRCGRKVVNTAFTAAGGERVQLHLDAPAERDTAALAQVVPAP